MSADHNAFTPEQEAELREALKRCSPETLNAALAYRKDGDSSQVSTVIIGVIERFVEPEAREKLLQPNADELNVSQDLGVDSLTMVEVVMLVEETLDTHIDNDELQNLTTIGAIKSFVQKKIGG